MVARYIQRAIELGRTRLDFLRGNEPYKYEWGAVDAPIERLLVSGRASGRACPRRRSRWADDGAADDPCAETGRARPPCPAARSASWRVMATGTNGGAQEHVYSLVTRMDPCRVRRQDRVPVARQQRPPAAEGRVRRHGHRRAGRSGRHPGAGGRPGRVRARSASTTTCIGPRSWARAPPSSWARRAASARPSSSTVHSSRVRCADDREILRQLTPLMDRLIVVSQGDRAQDPRGGPRRAPRSA